MDSSLLPEQNSLTIASEVSSIASLLERGLHYVQQGRYFEGIAFFTLAHERLSSDQMHVANILDAFIASYKSYWQTEEALQHAYKSFADAEAEWQVRLTDLGRLLPVMMGETDPKIYVLDQSALYQTMGAINRAPTAFQSSQFCQPRPSLTQDYNSYQSPHLLSVDFDDEQSPIQPHPKDGDTLPDLYVTCFGRFEVKRFDQAIVLCHNRSGQVILRYLIAQSGYCASIDTLMDMLWPEDEPEVARHKLQIAVSAVRRSLNSGYCCDPGGGYILCKDRHYQLNPAVMIQTDVDKFLSLWQAGLSSGGSEALGLYESACRLYTDPFLVEDRYADWSFTRREQLSQIYLAMCRTLANSYLEAGRYGDAAKWAGEVLKEDRCDEEAHRQLIRIYAIQGRRGEALRQYQRCKRILVEELEILPALETVNLLQALHFTGEEIERK